jgi:hypothetical protein
MMLCGMAIVLPLLSRLGYYFTYLGCSQCVGHHCLSYMNRE